MMGKEDIVELEFKNSEIFEQSIGEESETEYVEVSPSTEADIQVYEGDGWNSGESKRHSDLPDKYEPNQHIIESISGLREELDEIEALKTVYSDKHNVANYYKWSDSVLDESGYFVSLVPHTDEIIICDGSDIFGVTVDSAGFIGGETQDQTKAKTCGLVVTSGFVGVKCESDVIEGDYVVSNVYGIATKTDSKCGYKVVALGDKNGVGQGGPNSVPYAYITLGVQACTTDLIGKDVQQIEERVRNAEINIANAINIANEAHKKTEEVISSNKSMADQVTDAVNKVNDITSNVEDIESQVSNIATITEQAKTIAESAATSAESAKNVAYEKANEMLDKAGEIEQIVEPISRWEYTDPVTGETNVGAEYFAEYVVNGLSTKAEMATVSAMDEENKLLIEKNAKNYTRMLSSVDKYTIGEYSQAYGLTLEQAKNILKEGMIYIPTKNDGLDTHTEKYVNGDSYVEYSFTYGFYYVWNGDIWSEAIGAVWFDSEEPSGTAYTYWYNGNELYILDINTWTQVAILAGNVNNRITSMVRQDVDNISVELSNARGSSASLSQRLSDTEAKINSSAFWKNDDGSQYVAAFQQVASGGGSSLSLVAYRTDTSAETEKDASKILKGASVVIGQGDNDSYIQIDADNIVLKGGVSFTIPDSEDSSITRINGASIATGSITAYKIDATGITATNVDISGEITATTGRIGSQASGWTIDENSIYHGTSFSDANSFLCTGSGASFTIAGHNGNGWVLKAGNNFGVTNTGALYCSTAHIEGEITATSGFIGDSNNGFQINNKGLYCGNTLNNTKIQPNLISNTYRWEALSCNLDFTTKIESGLLDISVNVEGGATNPLIDIITVNINGAMYGIYIDETTKTIKVRDRG